MNTTKQLPKTIAVLKLAQSPQTASAQAKAILSGLENNPSIFVTPNPPLATLKADIAALDSAETDALKRTKGAAEARNAKLAVVIQDLHDARAYVNKIASADPVNAAAIITAAGLFVKKPAVKSKQLLAAKQGPSTGIVLLEAKAVARRAAYFWQWSLDQKSWTDLPPTLVSHTTVINLAPAVLTYFRVRGQSTASHGDWSDVASLIVH